MTKSCQGTKSSTTRMRTDIKQVPFAYTALNIGFTSNPFAKEIANEKNCRSEACRRCGKTIPNLRGSNQEFECRLDKRCTAMELGQIS